MAYDEERRKRDPVFDPTKKDVMIRLDPVLEPKPPIRRMGGPAGITETQFGKEYAIHVIDPLVQIAALKKEAAIKAKGKGKHIQAGIQASGFMLANVAVALAGAPVSVAEAGKAVQNVVKDPLGFGISLIESGRPGARTIARPGKAARRGVAYIAADPVAFTGQVAGGILAGAIASDFVNVLRGPKQLKTLETKTYRKPKIGRGFSRTSFDAKKVVMHTDDFLGAHQVKAGGSWPKSGRVGLGKPHYLQTGEGLMETIPYSGGVEQTVYRLTTKVTRRPTQLRGSYLVTRTVTTHVPRAPSIMGPLVGVGIRPFSPLKPAPQIQYPREQLKEISAVSHIQKDGLKQAIEYRPISKTKQTPLMILPGYTPAPQKIIPISRPRITPTLIPPGYRLKLGTVEISVPVTVPVGVPNIIPRIPEYRPPRERRKSPPPPFIPRITRVDPPYVPPTRGRRRRPKKKKGYDPLSLDIWGEMREYPVKTPKNVLKSLGLRL